MKNKDEQSLEKTKNEKNYEYYDQRRDSSPKIWMKIALEI